MQISTNYDNTAPKPFELPEGVTVKDGELVDNRAWYQTRLTGNETLASLKDQYEKAEKEKKENAESKYSYNPFTLLGNFVSWLGDLVKGFFFCCPDKKEATEETTGEKTEKA